MPEPELPQARPQTVASVEEESTEESEASAASDGGTVEPVGEDGTIEQLIQDRIDAQTAELERELSELKEEVEAIDSFARLSLNERKIKQSEVNLSEFSESMSSFAEKAFNNINALEDRLNLQALLLTAVLDALNEEGVDLDLGEVERQQEDSLVMDQTPHERLESAIEEF